jgi:Sec-independent protein translocase protein TatA
LGAGDLKLTLLAPSNAPSLARQAHYSIKIIEEKLQDVEKKLAEKQKKSTKNPLISVCRTVLP